LLIIILTALSSCATKYKELGKNGGYTDEKINDRVYKVTFQGNTRTSDEKVHQYFMRRSAEVALLHHFQYFTVIESNDITRFTTVVSNMPPVTKARTAIFPYASSTIFTPTEYKTLPKHMLTGTIQLYKEGEQPPNAFSVEKTLENVRL
jgi:hypothetical protein